MSNYIRGTIDTGVDFLIVGRTVFSQGGVYYGTYMALDEDSGLKGFFGSLVDYKTHAVGNYKNLKPVTFRYTKQTDTGLGFQFMRTGVLEGTSGIVRQSKTTPIVTNVASDSVLFFEDQRLFGAVTSIPTNLYLNPYLPLDTRILFAGAWYSLADKYDNILKYNWFTTTPRIINGFNPNVTDIPSLTIAKTDIMFVPFSFLGWKIINGTYKALSAPSDFMVYVDGWIKGDPKYNLNNCEADLTDPSTNNCIFTTGKIQGLSQGSGFAYGWRYCTRGESGFDGCLGKCEDNITANSTYCQWSLKQKKFLCGPDEVRFDEDRNYKNQMSKWLKLSILLVFIFIIIVILVIFLRKRM